jgi:hypothetical protein
MRFGQHRPKLLRRSLQVLNSKWSKNMLKPRGDYLGWTMLVKTGVHYTNIVMPTELLRFAEQHTPHTHTHTHTHTHSLPFLTTSDTFLQFSPRRECMDGWRWSWCYGRDPFTPRSPVQHNPGAWQVLGANLSCMHACFLTTWSSPLVNSDSKWSKNMYVYIYMHKWGLVSIVPNYSVGVYKWWTPSGQKTCLFVFW